MALYFLSPAVTAVALFVIGVIIVMLRFGHKCGLRHHALPDDRELREKTYEHEISYA